MEIPCENCILLALCKSNCVLKDILDTYTLSINCDLFMKWFYRYSCSVNDRVEMELIFGVNKILY